MANTDTDNYIDTVHIGSEINTDLGVCTVTDTDEYGCVATDDEGDIHEFTWGEVGEWYAESKAEDEANFQVDSMRDNEPY